jgi:cGMP-dependent protein kinase
MGKGDSFGEQALYYNTKRSCSVKAETEVLCLSLGRDILVSVLGNKVQLITFKNMIKWSFERSDHLCKLTKQQIEKVSDNIDFVKFKAGEIIYSSDNKYNHLIVILEGSIRLVREFIKESTWINNLF